MSNMQLTPEQYRHLTTLLTRYGGVNTVAERQFLLDSAGLSDFASRLGMDNNAQIFSSQLVRVLQDYGILKSTGQPTADSCCGHY